MDTFTLVGSICIVIFAITTHEAAHAWVADKLGDPTARLMGRITLNPLPHIDLYLTILLPAILLYTTGIAFGGAKPVPVQIHRMRKPFQGMALVAIAGPLSNFLQALLWGALLSLFLNFGIWDESAKGIEILRIGIIVNIVLMVFNLMPIPPLDGSRVVIYFLKGEARKTYASLERYGILILIALILFGRESMWQILSFFINPLVEFVIWVTGIPISAGI
ncbi:MAG: site-2 protease family protein [Planctomycetota bacterium]